MRVFAYAALAALASTGVHAFYPYPPRLAATVGDDVLHRPSLDKRMADLESPEASTTNQPMRTDRQNQIVVSGWGFGPGLRLRIRTDAN